MALAPEATGVPVLDRLVQQLGKLPGIGPKSADRLMHFLLSAEPGEVTALADALRALKSSVHLCKQCSHITETELCHICADPRRDQGLICVVEESRHLMALERTASFRGVYHVLRGRLAPLDNMGPELLSKAVAMNRKDNGGRIKLEASGNVRLETVKSIAETGVDYISTSKITMAAPTLDLGLDIGIR